MEDAALLGLVDSARHLRNGLICAILKSANTWRIHRAAIKRGGNSSLSSIRYIPHLCVRWDNSYMALACGE
jgi:hypothetical protein